MLGTATVVFSATTSSGIGSPMTDQKQTLLSSRKAARFQKIVRFTFYLVASSGRRAVLVLMGKNPQTERW